MTPGLRIRLKRHPDGSASLTRIRDDGTTTWQRHRGATATVPVPILTDGDIARVRASRDARLARWLEVQPGESLELDFARG